MNRHQSNPTGLTLIELVLYVGLASLMLLMTSSFLATLLQARIKNQTIAEVEQQGQMVIQTITKAVRNANAISSPAVGASAGSLTISTYAAGSNPTVFNLSAGGAITITEGAIPAVTLTNSRVVASALTFQNLSRSSTPGTVRVQFTLNYFNPNGRQEYNYGQTFLATATVRQP